jgi:hypothetical protein
MDDQVSRVQVLFKEVLQQLDPHVARRMVDAFLMPGRAIELVIMQNSLGNGYKTAFSLQVVDDPRLRGDDATTPL